MAPIATRPQIVQIESQIRPRLNWFLVVGVQVSFATVVSPAKLREYSIRRRIAEVIEEAVSYDIRYPGAIYAAPAVPLEAQDSQPPVVGIVSALGAGAPAHVMFTLSCHSVGLAGSTGREHEAAWDRAGTEYPHALRNSL